MDSMTPEVIAATVRRTNRDGEFPPISVFRDDERVLWIFRALKRVMSTCLGFYACQFTAIKFN